MFGLSPGMEALLSAIISFFVLFALPFPVCLCWWVPGHIPCYPDECSPNLASSEDLPSPISPHRPAYTLPSGPPPPQNAIGLQSSGLPHPVDLQSNTPTSKMMQVPQETPSGTPTSSTWQAPQWAPKAATHHQLPCSPWVSPQSRTTSSSCW